MRCKFSHLRKAYAPVRASSVRDVMTEHPIVAPEDISLRSLVDDWFLRRDWSAFPLVTPSGEVSALVTLARVKSMPRHDWDRLTAGAVGDPVATVASGAPNEPLPELLERMATATGGSGRALVFGDGAFVGIITPTDVQRAIDLAALRSPRARAEPGEQARTPTASSV